MTSQLSGEKFCSAFGKSQAAKIGAFVVRLRFCEASQSSSGTKRKDRPCSVLLLYNVVVVPGVRVC